MDDVDDKLIVQAPGLDFAAGGYDASACGWVQEPQFLVGERRGHLDLRQGADQAGVVRNRRSGDGEVFNSAQSVDPQ